MTSPEKPARCTDMKPALDGALSGFGARLRQYLAAPGDTAALDEARGELHRLLDMLEAAGLRGVTAFGTELETVLDELAAQPGMCSELHRDTLRRALSALAHHLDRLADGADDAALHLFAEYQSLQQLRGLEMSFELDLFHPDQDVQLPQRILDMPREGDTPHRLRTLRSQYQQGLLHWLHRDDAPAALQTMRQALDGVLRCLPQDGSRAFWWVAGGLLDCLQPDGAPAAPGLDRLLGRIDQQMRALCSAEGYAAAEGQAGEARPILDEMLYLIGRSRAASEAIEEIRLAYALEYYLPEPDALPPGEAAHILDALREQLHAAEESWERCTQGSQTACETFAAHAARLAAQGATLGNPALRYLTLQIHALAQHANGAERARLVALDMAMALLLLGSGIRYYGSLGSGFLKEARILSARMQAALAQQSEDAQQLAELVRLHCLLQQGDVKTHLFNEMLANLHYVEQGLSAFFGDPAKRNELDELLRLSGQIRGGLHIASLERAEQLLAAIQGGLRRFAQGDDVPEAAESRAMAGAVNALQDYLQRLARRQAGDIAPLQAALDAMAELRQAAAAAGAPEAPRAPAAAVLPATEDQELLEVFLEEAQEVLHAMRNDLEACRLHLDRESLVNIRRGFHTLKGSGRMVGLTDLGEAAWNVERALNKWLQDNRPPTAGLLDFIAGAGQSFGGWVDALNSQGGVSIEADALAEAARQIEDGIEPGEAPEQPAASAPAAAAGEGAALPAPAEEAPPAPPPPAAAIKQQVRDDIDAQLLPVFLEEADELLPQIGAGLRAWRGQPDDERQPQLLKRMLHTFKGGARMAGAMRIGGIAHEMEEQVLATREVSRTEPWDALEGSLDRIAGLLEKLRSGAGQRPPAYAGVERRKERRTTEGSTEHAMLRVRTDLLDRLVGEAGEIGMARARMEAEMHAFKEGLQELTGSVARLRKQLREVEMQAESRMQARASSAPDSAEQFDPLEFDRFTRLQELTRFMNESVHDVQTVQQALLKNFDSAATALAAQARLSRELQQNLMGVRMVPFASIAERLYRVVRQTAKELDKRANLELSGTELELDRSVLERMTAPFEHLLRNALAHGIESEAVRAQRGKNPIGDIRLGLRHAGNEVVFEFGDDGAGLDLAALRDKALAMDLLRPDETAGDDQLAQLVLTSGISTANEVTEVAGRGIGMGVVSGEVAALGGRIEVSSRQGQGTQFAIHLPLTLAVTHVLMVRSGNATYAIPSAMVEQVRQVKPDELAQFYRDRRIEWQGHAYPLHYLPHLLGDTGRTPENRRHNPLVLLRSGELRIALHVDALLGNQEAMVKNTGPQLAHLPVIAGATVQGNGAVALILNPAQLAQRIAAAPPGEAAPAEPHAQPLVMVVDDSLTVRKVTTRLLARAGYRVATAKDGMDALEQLGGTLPDAMLPDVMLLDIEMPRMDGFELTKHLRRDARTQRLPIIMITSRAADKHRDYAMQLGANAYLGKPYQEEALLQQIAVFIPAARAV
jgi:chemosensory pili system protein ChpA (sensor histidine kinase/response regulator)